MNARTKSYLYGWVVGIIPALVMLVIILTDANCA